MSADLYDAYDLRLDSPDIDDDDPYDWGAQWGYYRDQCLGLVLMGWRYYDPAAGRFLTRDPIGYDGGINLYAYCRKNPVNLIDPLGLTADWTGSHPPNKGRSRFGKSRVNEDDADA